MRDREIPPTIEFSGALPLAIPFLSFVIIRREIFSDSLAFFRSARARAQL